MTDQPIDFIIIGSQKAGTTSLASILSSHPEIAFSKEKEPHYFSLNKNWQQNIKSYHKLFENRKNARIRGEASTSYSFLDEYDFVPKNLFEYNNNLKLIYILRNPIERIRSHYAHRLMRGLASSDMNKELLNVPEYINRTMYGKTLETYSNIFNKEAILILFFEEFISSPQIVLQKVKNHLGLLTDLTARETRHNISSLKKMQKKKSIRYNIDYLLTFSPPWLRRILKDYITIKLKEKPLLPPELQMSILEKIHKDQELLKKYISTRAQL